MTAVKIWRLLRGARLRSPKRCAVVIFDAEGSAVVSELVLTGVEVEVLPARQEVLFLAPGILLRTLWNLRLARELKLRQVYLAHLLACLQVIGPKVVVTWIDNGVYFHKLSRRYLRARFIAIQNGLRTVRSVATPAQHPDGWLDGGSDWGRVLSFPDYFCFGAQVEELYRRFGHQVDRFHPVGSVLAGYFKTVVSPGEAPVEHELCLISEWRRSIMDGSDYPDVREALVPLYEGLSRWARERGVRVCVACSLADPGEKEYFRDLFGPSATLIDYSREGFSTYRAMDRSALSVCLLSTAGFEAMSWGKKVLFCNLPGRETMSCPLPGPWSLTGGGYPALAERLDALRAMTPEAFRAAAREAASKMMAFDPSRPAHRQIRRAVEEALSA